MFIKLWIMIKFFELMLLVVCHAGRVFALIIKGNHVSVVQILLKYKIPNLLAGQKSYL